MNLDLRARWQVLRSALVVLGIATGIAVSPLAVERLYAVQYEICCEVNCLFGTCGAEGVCTCECVLWMPVCSCV